jgi:toxin HigB-1
MIESFKCRETEKVFRRERSRKFPPEIQRQAKKKLYLLDASVSLGDLKIPPGNRLESLAGNRKGQHSIRISDPWRICFHWRDNDAHDVEIVDYH